MEQEQTKCCDEKKMDKCWNHIVTQLFWEYFIAVYGNLSVNMISKYGQANQHLIAGSTTLVISILFPTKAVLIQSSTLAGLMDYSRTYQSIAFVLVTGIFVLIINRVFDKICSDIGGKSGCIGFFANFFTTLICYLISFTKWYEFDVTGLMWDPSEYAVMDKFVLISTPFITAMASVSIHLVIRHKESFIKIAGKNGGYGIIAIFGSLWFQAISSEFIIKRGNAISYGEYCIIFWNAGCMCGLTDKRFFKKWIPGYEFHNYLIIGFITGWLRIGTMGIANLGGKQGICAFIASMFFIWTLEIFNWYFEFDKGEKEQEAEITRNLNTISGTITERTPVNDQIKDGNKSSERNDEGNDVNDRNYEGNEDGNEDGNDNNKVDNIQELHIMREIENGLNGMNMRKISTKTIDTLTFNENFNNVISNEMMDNQLTIVEGNTANNIIYNNYEKVDLMSPPCKYESNRSNQIVELSVNDFEIKLSNTENKRILKNLEDSNYSDSKIIDKLKKELVKIVSKLNITLTRLSDTEQKLDNVEVKCEDLENTIKALNDSLLTAKQEILRLELENAKEIEKSNNYYEMYQYIVLEKEKMEFSMIYDIKQLKNKISFVKSEKEHMSNMLKIHNINNEQILSNIIL